MSVVGDTQFTDQHGNLLGDYTRAQLDALMPEVRVKLPLAGAADTAGGIGAFVNPEAVAIYVSQVIVVSTHVSTGACTMDVGSAVNGTTLADNLIDGLDLTIAVPNINSNLNAPGAAATNDKNAISVPVGGAVTFSTASGAAAGFTGAAYIFYTTLD